MDPHKSLTCGACGGSKDLKVCSKCKVQHYCSRDCQVTHHISHMMYCGETAAVRATKKTIPKVAPFKQVNPETGKPTATVDEAAEVQAALKRIKSNAKNAKRKIDEIIGNARDKAEGGTYKTVDERVTALSADFHACQMLIGALDQQTMAFNRELLIRAGAKEEQLRYWETHSVKFRKNVYDVCRKMETGINPGDRCASDIGYHYDRLWFMVHMIVGTLDEYANQEHGDNLVESLMVDLLLKQYQTKQQAEDGASPPAAGSGGEDDEKTPAEEAETVDAKAVPIGGILGDIKGFFTGESEQFSLGKDIEDIADCFELHGGMKQFFMTKSDKSGMAEDNAIGTVSTYADVFKAAAKSKDVKNDGEDTYLRRLSVWVRRMEGTAKDDPHKKQQLVVTVSRILILTAGSLIGLRYFSNLPYISVEQRSHIDAKIDEVKKDINSTVPVHERLDKEYQVCLKEATALHADVARRQNFVMSGMLSDHLEPGRYLSRVVGTGTLRSFGTISEESLGAMTPEYLESVGYGGVKFAEFPTSPQQQQQQQRAVDPGCERIFSQIEPGSGDSPILLYDKDQLRRVADYNMAAQVNDIPRPDQSAIPRLDKMARDLVDVTPTSSSPLSRSESVAAYTAPGTAPIRKLNLPGSRLDPQFNFKPLEDALVGPDSDTRDIRTGGHVSVGTRVFVAHHEKLQHSWDINDYRLAQNQGDEIKAAMVEDQARPIFQIWLERAAWAAKNHADMQKAPRASAMAQASFIQTHAEMEELYKTRDINVVTAEAAGFARTLGTHFTSSQIEENGGMTAIMKSINETLTNLTASQAMMDDKCAKLQINAAETLKMKSTLQAEQLALNEVWRRAPQSPLHALFQEIRMGTEAVSGARLLFASNGIDGVMEDVATAAMRMMKGISGAKSYPEACVYITGFVASCQSFMMWVTVAGWLMRFLMLPPILLGIFYTTYRIAAYFTSCWVNMKRNAEDGKYQGRVDPRKCGGTLAWMGDMTFSFFAFITQVAANASITVGTAFTRYLPGLLTLAGALSSIFAFVGIVFAPSTGILEGLANGVWLLPSVVLGTITAAGNFGLLSQRSFNQLWCYWARANVAPLVGWLMMAFASTLNVTNNIVGKTGLYEAAKLVQMAQYTSGGVYSTVAQSLATYGTQFMPALYVGQFLGAKGYEYIQKRRKKAADVAPEGQPDIDKLPPKQRGRTAAQSEGGDAPRSRSRSARGRK